MGKSYDASARDMLADYVADNVDAVRNALQVYARHMREEAAAADEQYRRGAADDAVREAMNGSLVTHEGYRMSAELFRQSALRAEDIAARVNELLEAVAEHDAEVSR